MDALTRLERRMEAFRNSPTGRKRAALAGQNILFEKPAMPVYRPIAEVKQYPEGKYQKPITDEPVYAVLFNTRPRGVKRDPATITLAEVKKTSLPFTKLAVVTPSANRQLVLGLINRNLSGEEVIGYLMTHGPLSREEAIYALAREGIQFPT